MNWIPSTRILKHMLSFFVPSRPSKLLGFSFFSIPDITSFMVTKMSRFSSGFPFQNIAFTLSRLKKVDGNFLLGGRPKRFMVHSNPIFKNQYDATHINKAFCYWTDIMSKSQLQCMDFIFLTSFCTRTQAQSSPTCEKGIINTFGRTILPLSCTTSNPRDIYNNSVIAIPVSSTTSTIWARCSDIAFFSS